MLLAAVHSALLFWLDRELAECNTLESSRSCSILLPV